MSRNRPDPRRAGSWCREGAAHDHGACGPLWDPASPRDIEEAARWADEHGPRERLEAKAAELRAAGYLVVNPTSREPADRHTCDGRCVCPLDGKPLLYAPGWGAHACQDPVCPNAHGVRGERGPARSHRPEIQPARRPNPKLGGA